MDKTQGLTCPNCAVPVPVPEGRRVVVCESCGLRSLVQGERGIERWQVLRKVDRPVAESAIKSFFVGMNKAFDLRAKANIRELFLVYLPYWRVQAYFAGYRFGRVTTGSGKNKRTKPIEVEVFEEMRWNDAATDVSEFGVNRVTISLQDLEPYDSQRLHAEGMVFEPAESPTDAVQEADQHFTHRARQKKKLSRTFFEKFNRLREKLGIVYYPLWVARYEYKERNYQVVVDGVNGNLLYGKAPGNIFYRAAMLVATMALGNLILVNGTALALTVLGDADDEVIAIACVPLAMGLAIIAAGYRAFRYGEEVEKVDATAKKAAGTGGKEQKGQSFLDTGLSVLEELGQ